MYEHTCMTLYAMPKPSSMFFPPSITCNNTNSEYITDYTEKVVYIKYRAQSQPGIYYLTLIPHIQ